MGLFDSLMAGAKAFQDRINPAPTQNESVFRKIGRIPLTALGIAPSPITQPTPEEIPQDIQPQDQSADLPIGEIPDINTRDIPEGSQIVGQEAIDLYPPDSDVAKVLKNGYSLVTDPSNGSVLGMSDGQGHLMSPDEALNPKAADQTLQENGFHAIPENIDRFLKQNPNTATEAKNLDFTGLKPLGDSVVLDKPEKTIMDYVWENPAFHPLANTKTLFQVLGEGFSRYEGIKASLMLDAQLDPLKAATNAGKSVMGEAKTDFPDAALRSGKAPELGDLFRKMGMPELAAAIGGLTLDIVTDLGVGAVTGKYLKQAMQGYKIVTKAGVTTNAFDAMKDGWMAFRSKQAATLVEDAIKGIRSTDIPGSPSFNRLERALQGQKRLANYDAHTAANEVHRIVSSLAKETIGADGVKVAGKNTDEINKVVNEAIHNPRLLADGGGLPMEVLTPLRAWRGAVDKSSREIADQIKIVIAKNPEWAVQTQKEYSKKTGMKAGELIPLEKLPEVIASNEGNYVTRAYEMFQPNWVAPKVGSELHENMVRGLMEEYDMTTKEALQKVDEIVLEKNIRLPERTKLERTFMDVNKGSFKARQQIPAYIREFMGEIKDPIWNMRNTQRNLSDSIFKFKLFNTIDDMGLASSKLDKGLNHVIKVKGDSLAWGPIAEKYISPELDALLTTVKSTDEVMESAYLGAMRFVKAMKTTMNPAGHIRQSVQNMGFTAGVNGVSPFNPKNLPLYFGDGGVKDILIDVMRNRAGKTVKNPKNIELYREMIKNGLIGNELPLEDIGGYMEKVARGIGENSIDIPAMKGTVSHILGGMASGAKKVGKVASEAWAMEDMVVKIAAYLKKTKGGMAPAEAVDEIFKFTPNYAETSRLAKYVRNSPTAMIFLNPFFTFKSESHRILLNVLKSGSTEQKAWLTGTMGSRFALNTAMLAAAGNGMKDIKEIYMSKPELVSEALLNPFAMDSGEYDINTKYIDPFNAQGIFAPIMTHSGATGMNPLDYLLDFTNFSPEFGYGSIIPDSVEGLLTGRGKFGQELSTNERVMSAIQGIGPSSINNIPKILDESKDPNERIRRAFKLVGLDFEKRNAPWIKSSIKNRLEQKIANNEDPTATINAIKQIGFDPDVMLKSIKKKLDGGKPIEKKAPTERDKTIAKSLAAYGF